MADSAESTAQGRSHELVRLLEAVRRAIDSEEETPVREMGQVLEHHPEVRDRVISEANAVSTGIWRRIDSVHHATARLGLRRLEQIVGSFVTQPPQVPPAPHIRTRAVR